MSIIELVTALNSALNPTEAAQLAIDSKLAGAKDIYLAWGKEKGFPVKELNKVWADEQPKKATGGANGFAAEFYDWLAEEARTEQEAYELIMSGSQNVQNHLTHYLNIWALAETVRSGQKVYRTITAKGKATRTKSNKEEQPQDTWEYNDANPFADIRSAQENLKRETKRARPRKTRIHPDKVSHLGDAALTEAYTAAFKAYFNKAA